MKKKDFQYVWDFLVFWDCLDSETSEISKTSEISETCEISETLFVLRFPSTLWTYKSRVTQFWAGCTNYQPEISILDPIREEKRFRLFLRFMRFYHWSSLIIDHHWSSLIIDHHWSLIIIQKSKGECCSIPRRGVFFPEKHVLSWKVVPLSAIMQKVPWNVDFTMCFWRWHRRWLEIYSNLCSPAARAGWNTLQGPY